MSLSQCRGLTLTLDVLQCQFMPRIRNSCSCNLAELQLLIRFFGNIDEKCANKEHRNSSSQMPFAEAKSYRYSQYPGFLTHWYEGHKRRPWLSVHCQGRRINKFYKGETLGRLKLNVKISVHTNRRCMVSTACVHM